MSQYEAQLIVEFLHGKDDEYIHHGSGALQAKFEMEHFVDCEIIRVNREDKVFSSLHATLKKLPENSPLYLCGHGNSLEKTIGAKVRRTLPVSLARISKSSVLVLSPAS